MVSDPELTQQIRQQYSGIMVILYDRILRHRKREKERERVVAFLFMYSLILNRHT